MPAVEEKRAEPFSVIKESKEEDENDSIKKAKLQ